MRQATVYSASNSITTSAAQEIAEEYLLLHVGDLLTVGDPRSGRGECWEFPIVGSNASGEIVSELGIIAVDTITGEIRFSAEELRKVKEGARLHTRADALSARA